MRYARLNAALAALCVARGDFSFVPQRYRAGFTPGVGLLDGEGGGGGGSGGSGGSGGGGTGTGGTGTKTYTQEEFDRELAGLRSKNNELLTKERQLRERYKPLEGIDADADTIRAALTDREKAEEARRKKEGEFETWRTDIGNKHKQALDAKEGEIAKVKTSLERHLIDGALVAAIAGAEGEPELLVPALRGQVRMVEQDGEFVARVVDAKGTPRLKDAAGNFMTIADLVSETKAKPKFGIAFKAPGAAGGGAGGSGAEGGGGGGTRSDADAIWISPEDAKVTSRYRAAREKAASEKKQLRIGTPGQK